MLRRLLDALPPRPQEPLHARVVAVLSLLAAMANQTTSLEKRTEAEMGAKLILGHHLLRGERRLLAQQLANGLDLLPRLGVHLVDGHLSNLHEEVEEEEVGVEEGV